MNAITKHILPVIAAAFLVLGASVPVYAEETTTAAAVTNYTEADYAGVTCAGFPAGLTSDTRANLKYSDYNYFYTTSLAESCEVTATYLGLGLVQYDIKTDSSYHGSIYFKAPNTSVVSMEAALTSKDQRFIFSYTTADSTPDGSLGWVINDSDSSVVTRSCSDVLVIPSSFPREGRYIREFSIFVQYGAIDATAGSEIEEGSIQTIIVDFFTGAMGAAASFFVIITGLWRGPILYSLTTVFVFGTFVAIIFNIIQHL